MDEQGKTSALLSVDAPVRKLFYLEKRGELAVITENLMMSQYTLGPEGGAHEFMKVYLDSTGAGKNVIHFGNSIQKDQLLY